MADLTIAETALSGGRIRYTLGAGNWTGPADPGHPPPRRRRRGAERRMIDVILLGDGYTTAASFRAALEDWIAAFYALRVYDVFAGCLRVRALYTPSTEPASSRRARSTGASSPTTGARSRRTTGGPRATPTASRSAAALWAGVDTFADANPRRYPLDLDVGATDQAITNDRLRDLYRNLVVWMLVSSAATGHPSGFTSRRVAARAGRTADTSGSRSEPTRSTSSATASGCSRTSTSTGARRRTPGA